MKVVSIFFLILAATCSVMAQTHEEKVNSLIETERAFARMAKEQTNKKAFVHYSGDETILFTANGITNGKKFWQEAKEDSSLFVWHPSFAGTSAAGDIGFTAGPSAYYGSRRKNEQPAYGAYISVWRNENKAWRLILDVGVYPQPAWTEEPFVARLRTSSNDQPDKSSLSEVRLLEAEAEFVKSASAEAKLNRISDQAHFYRIQNQVANQRAQITDLLTAEEPRELVQAGYGLSSSGDLGYVYGTTKTKVSDKIVTGYYVRIWKFTTDWRVVVDVLTD